jgi:hypothetical protein
MATKLGSGVIELKYDTGAPRASPVGQDVQSPVPGAGKRMVKSSALKRRDAVVAASVNSLLNGCNTSSSSFRPCYS